jgi:hypothetical protein
MQSLGLGYREFWPGKQGAQIMIGRERTRRITRMSVTEKLNLERHRANRAVLPATIGAMVTPSQ